MRYASGSRITLSLRLGMWLTGFAVVLVFAIVNFRFDPTLSQFAAPAQMSPGSPVDQNIYVTSRALASLAATPQERHLAVLAMRAADHELDQSFATAIRNSASSRLVLPAPALAVSKRIEQTKEQIKADSAQIRSLTKSLNPDSEPAEAQVEQLRVAQAQLARDNDELDNLQQDFARLGGDKQQEVQQAFDQHRAMEGQATALPQNTATAALESLSALHSLLGKFRILQSLKQRRKSLASAGATVDQAVRDLHRQHDELETKHEGPLPSGKLGPAKPSAAVANLQFLSDRQKDMADTDRRIRDLGQLTDAYNSWQSLILGQIHTIGLAITADLIAIGMALLGIFVISGIAQSLVKKCEAKYHRRLDHARVFLALLLEVIVIARIAVIIFGMPGDVSTIVGLVTAGITVALKDFLVSFVGWFSVMGKRGIQVGDWVEIDGTQGEVVKITILHTYLLETGNWATPGHPTGRQAVFMNKFAVEKKYFNFSTTAQWLWDEIAIPVPVTKQISQQTLAKVREVIEQQTRNDTAQAVAAWQEIVSSHSLTKHAVTPSVVVRTNAAGLEVVIRYVSKASIRFDRAVRLRQEVLHVLDMGVAEIFDREELNQAVKPIQSPHREA